MKIVTISGKITGLTNAKIYLGNKPNGIGAGFKYQIFDSVYSMDGSFEFRNFNFSEVGFFSIEAEDSKGWLTFIIDTGHIIINAKKDSIYRGKVEGSHENALYLLYREKIAIPEYYSTISISDSLDKYRNKDTVQYSFYFRSLEIQQKPFTIARKDFIKKYASNFISIFILNDIKRSLPTDSLSFYFGLLSPEMQNNSNASDLKYRSTNFPKNMMAGSIVPDFIFLDTSGAPIELYNIRAEYKLINFWASWCAPCLAELPELKTFHVNNKNVSIISFSIDYDKKAWVQSSKDNKIPWYSFSDLKGPEGKFASHFSVLQIPLMILLNSKNEIIKYNIQLSELDEFIEKN